MRSYSQSWTADQADESRDPPPAKLKEKKIVNPTDCGPFDTCYCFTYRDIYS